MLYASVGVLFLVTSVIGTWRVVEVRQQLIGDSLNRTYLAAAAYAQAAERWIMDGEMETLHRVSRLMLTSETRFVEIRGSNQVLLELRASDMPPEMGARSTDTIADAPSRSLLRTSIGWVIEVVIPLEQAPMNSQEVRVWMDAETLHMRVTSSSLKTSAIAIACWLALSGGIFLGCCRTRRGTQDDGSQFASSPWTVDFGSRRISIDDRPISLTPKQYALLSLLISGGNRVFSEEEILESIWPHSSYADSNDIRQCVYKIRRRVSMVAPGAEACIVNEKGFGYRFEPSELPIHYLEANTTIMRSSMNQPSERRNQ